MESRQVDLYPRHAGIDEGRESSLSNSPTSPQGVITNLQGTGKFSNARIATLTFTFQSVNITPTGASYITGAVGGVDGEHVRRRRCGRSVQRELRLLACGRGLRRC